MSKPWHGKIAALSPLYLIRDNMGGWDGGVKAAELEERYKMGERGKRWWEVERSRLWC